MIAVCSLSKQFHATTVWYITDYKVGCTKLHCMVWDCNGYCMLLTIKTPSQAIHCHGMILCELLTHVFLLKVSKSNK